MPPKHMQTQNGLLVIQRLARRVLFGTDENFGSHIYIYQVMLVASVASINSQATNNVYWLDDGYGRIEARHWIDATSEEGQEKWGGIECVFSLSFYIIQC
jgi:hypothetical protein